MKALSDLKIGESAIIEAIEIKGILKRRMIDMGMTKGSKVKVEKVAPMGDPIDIKVKDFHVAIRKSDARNIYVKEISN